jgi:hypothetical protein
MLLLYAISVALCWLLTRKFFFGVVLAVVVDVALFAVASLF